MSNAPANEIVWIDCEMTGLDPERDGLCEIAVIVTDFELRPLHPGFEIVINPGSDALDSMGDFVRNMHERSGLLSRISTGATVAEAERQVIEYVSGLVVNGRKPIVAGNTIGMDRRFIAKYMPNLEERLHYRSIDVSTIKELSRQWYPAAFFAAPEKNGNHRALTDIAESIRELAYFRQAVMVADRGPAKTESESLAAATVASFASLISAGNPDSSQEETTSSADASQA